ncbi:hypothetical protein Glove_69g69 [Diversispora epigaea]|uniref:Uncharacterized protein n=1 Tax=Diversispora epigaea TaxID=1348612 RepID=A0A397JB42_9GLOM|nr:hypothetical protein Glove_69g69 [Diversispora epigaea]
MNLDLEKTLYQKKTVFHPLDPYSKDLFDLKSLTQGDSFLDVKELALQWARMINPHLLLPNGHDDDDNDNSDSPSQDIRD